MNGVFGHWRTSYAADMMVDHPFSLMRTSEKPKSFFTGGPVSVSGIYLDPVVTELFVGDSIQLEALLTPANADHKGSTLVIEGDVDAVSYNSSRGQLLALAKGIVNITAVSEENNQVSFSREIEVKDIPVDSISAWNQTFTGKGGAAPGINIYPNPNDGLLYISSDQQFAFDMKVLDLLGKVVLKETYTRSTKISTDQLSAGTYLVVHQGNGMIIRQKLIIL
jgi:hypothetical protein